MVMGGFILANGIQESILSILCRLVVHMPISLSLYPITPHASRRAPGEHELWGLSRWLEGKRGDSDEGINASHNIAIVALANKLARMAPAVLAKNEVYRYLKWADVSSQVSSQWKSARKAGCGSRTVMLQRKFGEVALLSLIHIDQIIGLVSRQHERRDPGGKIDRVVRDLRALGVRHRVRNPPVPPAL
jgi:hypothetical protein